MTIPSELVGPAFLSVVLAAAVIVALRVGSPAEPLRAVPAACLALAVQSLHVAEEFLAGFHLRVPALLGLEPWSGGFFVAFNLIWLAIWALAIGAFASGRAGLAAAAALWFLALAGVGNALWHSLLALAAGGYFPGLASALPAGAAGIFLARRLRGRSHKEE